MDIFCLFDKGSVKSEETAKQAISALSERGFNVLDESEGVEGALLKARALLLFFSANDEFNSRNVTDGWRFFQNELRWKRKDVGDIIIVKSDEAEARRLPFALKDSIIVQSSNFDELTEVLNALDKGQKPQAVSTGFSISKVEQIDNSDNEMDAKESVAEFLKKREQRENEDNGCKDDHIFEDIGYKHTQKIKTEKTVTRYETDGKDKEAMAERVEKTEKSDNESKKISHIADYHERLNAAIIEARKKTENEKGDNEAAREFKSNTSLQGNSSQRKNNYDPKNPFGNEYNKPYSKIPKESSSGCSFRLFLTLFPFVAFLLVVLIMLINI